ncbi:late cornified envelope protein 3A-like [Cavia porcellus]|uniref:late cornified envelope protein 3A-like n=1 Tax=Cavia porcellus TaxID=10141 RepID=UPI0003511074|nr:late cornified envelope protein 3A-like [Cavia porcellus]
MSCQQNQQQCLPPPKCPAPKCPQKSPAQYLPAAPSCSAPSSGGCSGLSSSSEGGCCLSHHRRRRSHRCRLWRSDSCDGDSGLQSGDFGCGHSSGGCC